MRVWFDAVRPRSSAGQVLVCAAAAVFAALLVVAWAPVPSDILR